MALWNKPGERVTKRATVVAETAIFTSFAPSTDLCTAGGYSWLYRMDYSDGTIRSRSWRVTTTDHQGQFAFSGIGLGRHTLSMRVDGYQEVSMDISIAQPIESVSIMLN